MKRNPFVLQEPVQISLDIKEDKQAWLTIESNILHMTAFLLSDIPQFSLVFYRIPISDSSLFKKSGPNSSFSMMSIFLHDGNISECSKAGSRCTCNGHSSLSGQDLKHLTLQLISQVQESVGGLRTIAIRTLSHS